MKFLSACPPSIIGVNVEFRYGDKFRFRGGSPSVTLVMWGANRLGVYAVGRYETA